MLWNQRIEFLKCCLPWLTGLLFVPGDECRGNSWVQSPGARCTRCVAALLLRWFCVARRRCSASRQAEKLPPKVDGLTMFDDVWRFDRRRKMSKRPSILKWVFFCLFHDVHDFRTNNRILRILLLHSAMTWRWLDGPIVQWCQAVSTWRSALKSPLANVTWRRLWCDGDDSIDSYHFLVNANRCTTVSCPSRPEPNQEAMYKNVLVSKVCDHIITHICPNWAQLAWHLLSANFWIGGLLANNER